MQSVLRSPPGANKGGEKSLGKGKGGYAWKISVEASVLSVKNNWSYLLKVDMEGKVREELMKVLCRKNKTRFSLTQV